MGRRLASSLLTLVIASVVSFVALELAPGDATELLVGGASRDISPEALQLIRVAQGLDRSPVSRYCSWLRSVATGNLGVSLKTNRPIINEFKARVPVSATIAAGALLMAIVVGLLLGIASVLYEGKLVDHVVRLMAVACHSVPAFIIGLLLIYVCSFRLGWLPLYGIGSGRGLVLRILTLGGVMGFSLARIARNTLLDAIHEEYFLAALAKGMSFRRALVRHGLRNSLTPLVTWMAMRFAGMLGGIVLVESLFSLPGMGSYILDAVFSRDYPAIQGYMIFFCVVVVAANLTGDILVRLIDPRAARARFN
jgi:ABC-type dipeptide/oligopeptide/nickel transport system permease component